MGGAGTAHPGNVEQLARQGRAHIIGHVGGGAAHNRLPAGLREPAASRPIERDATLMGGRPEGSMAFTMVYLLALSWSWTGTGVVARPLGGPPWNPVRC
ncbi:hypothetical protein GCM10012284_03210 [Mangrovihabitans endophyticus]|uniref:Uncharacterized protein n=1 Tax=Mangrovihabitans endophyticus TaxID=1751298 RepID=A0A8J3BWL4_9ACTN|nr:hypothetical protein GCM10012284_03210 [Mangrovihabitans endophyticus]